MMPDSQYVSFSHASSDDEPEGDQQSETRQGISGGVAANMGGTPLADRLTVSFETEIDPQSRDDASDDDLQTVESLTPPATIQGRNYQSTLLAHMTSPSMSSAANSPTTIELAMSEQARQEAYGSAQASGGFDPFMHTQSASNNQAVAITGGPTAETLVNVKGNSLLDDQSSVATQDSFRTGFQRHHQHHQQQQQRQQYGAHREPPVNSVFPGTAGYLEIEEEPPRMNALSATPNSAATATRSTPMAMPSSSRRSVNDQQHDADISRSPSNASNAVRNDGGEEPIKTSSGLLLTHRKSPTIRMPTRSPHEANPYAYSHAHDDDANQKRKGASIGAKTSNLFGALGQAGERFRPTRSQSSQPSHFNPDRDYFEMENGNSWSRGFAHRPQSGPSMALLKARRLLSFVRIWMVLAAALLLTFTGVFMHSFGHSDSDVTASADANLVAIGNGNYQTTNANTASANDQVPEQILLLPLSKDEISRLGQQNDPRFRMAEPMQAVYQQHHNAAHGQHRVLLEMEEELREKFESWAHHHGKKYHSHEEKEHRFHIWSHNHERTKQKNVQHGACKMTKKEVFGSNGLQDLTHEEFKARYLTGYKGLMGEDWHHHQKHKAVGPKTRRLSHGSGHVLDPTKANPKLQASAKRRVLSKRSLAQDSRVMSSSSANCNWYNVSCWLRWLFNSAGIQFGFGTMEPTYDADSYPVAVDWRDGGAVSDIKSQGDCGACWAITAVETIESATFLSTGQLYDLSETEVIVCDDTCEMCSGGWPQNAFEWVMEHNGLLLENDMAYDDEFLLELTEAMEGTSYTYTADAVQSYAAKICPAEGNSHDGSNDNNDNYNSGSQSQRYGQIDGYGYATDRCLCYTDGSGCNCDTQDEALAVRNVASYGPTTVCLEASLWQDYAGGIITAELGCTSAFLDMNHCVQIVGYAFNDGDEDGDDNNNSGSNSHSGSGSRDDSDREGYWIVRNQWGSSWGMNGYAYVAMGDNTCGILNDMTQVYSK